MEKSQKTKPDSQNGIGCSTKIRIFSSNALLSILREAQQFPAEPSAQIFLGVALPATGFLSRPAPGSESMITVYAWPSGMRKSRQNAKLQPLRQVFSRGKTTVSTRTDAFAGNAAPQG